MTFIKELETLKRRYKKSKEYHPIAQYGNGYIDAIDDVIEIIQDYKRERIVDLPIRCRNKIDRFYKDDVGYLEFIKSQLLEDSWHKLIKPAVEDVIKFETNDTGFGIDLDCEYRVLIVKEKQNDNNRRIYKKDDK